MIAIIKRELKNYMKNPVFWLGLIFILAEVFQILQPYLKLHYFSQQELDALEMPTSAVTDWEITEGFIPATKEERMEYVYDSMEQDMVESVGMDAGEVKGLIDRMRGNNMTAEEAQQYLEERGYSLFNYVEFFWQNSQYRRGNMQEVNAYIEGYLAQHSFSYYFGRKYADFCGLFMGFFATVLLAFLFIRDSKSDTYELLHTKPVSAAGYVCGKIAGGFLGMCIVWGILTLLFGALSGFYGRRNGLPVNFFDFLVPAVIYVLPNMLMITCIYALVALLFKNPLPAVPAMFLYLIYSNMGSRGPDGKYGYYGRPLAIMVRFPGRFFDTTPPPMALLNQLFLIGAAAMIMLLCICIWKRRRVY